jgi:inosine-uridine nucleoside N-ribohydrolase
MQSLPRLGRKPAIVDDDESVRVATVKLARVHGFVAYGFASAEEFLQSSRASDTSCLIIDESGITGKNLRWEVLGTADGPSGLEGSPYLPQATIKPVKQHAVDFLADALRASPEPILIVATGPLTNIGLLILKHRDVLPKIKELICSAPSRKRA